MCAGQLVQGQGAPSSPQSNGTRFEDSTNELSVAVGKAVLVDCAQPIQRVAVGQADIAEATAINPTEIMVNGKAEGETSLIIWDIHGGRQFFNVTVKASGAVAVDNLEIVRRELKMELPGQDVKVSYGNGSIFMRGTVKDLISSTRAVEIASTAGKVVNLLNVDVPDAQPQILLKVRFESVDRSKALTLGINLFNLGMGNTVGGITTGEFFPPTIQGSSSSSTQGGFAGSGGTASFSNGNELNFLAFFPGLGAGADIEALEVKGIADVLAQPNVMAINGKEASFLAGGEFPYPVVSGTSGGTAAVSIEFKEYGIRLNFIPTITPRGTIHLQVAPEVSTLDYNNEVAISGFEVPGLTERRVNTEVDLKDGESFLIGGLLDKSITDSFQKIPFLGDIPILGKFFQSESKTKNDTELIVIVTPEIITPYHVGEALPDLKWPDKFMPPNSNMPMNQPDAKTAENTLPPSAPTIPIEKLLDSMKPEKPLVVESGAGGFGSSGGAINSSTGSASTSTTTP